MNYTSLEFKIRNLNARKSEGEYWDFKQEWHKDNERLLHDILCFANKVHGRDCYLIIGVSDTGEIVGVNSENRKKQVHILDLLSNTVSLCVRKKNKKLKPLRRNFVGRKKHWQKQRLYWCLEKNQAILGDPEED